VFITAGPMIKLFAEGGGGEWILSILTQAWLISTCHERRVTTGSKTMFSLSKTMFSLSSVAFFFNDRSGSGRITIVILVSAIGGSPVLLVAAALGSP